MTNEEQAPRNPPHDPGQDGPAVVDPDDVVLDDGDMPAEALEPELSVTPDALDLQEPALEPARISQDTAEAASLEDAAAEARAVAAEAERTGTLVGGPMPADAPVVEAATDGTAPAGGPAGDPPDGQDRTADGEPGDPPDGQSDGRVGGAYAFPSEGGQQGLGDPGLHPGTDPAAVGPTRPSPARPATSAGQAGDDTPATSAGWVPTASGAGAGTAAHPTRDRTRTGGGSLPLLLVLGGVVVLLGLLIWLVLSLFGGSDDEDRVDPSSIAAGECLADFTDVTEDALLVECTEPHNAQLLASENYPEDAEFPGPDQLGLRAEAACAAASAEIDPEVVTDGLDVTLLRATPTTQTWADGDRRVDCFAVIGDGATVSRSLLTP